MHQLFAEILDVGCWTLLSSPNARLVTGIHICERHRMRIPKQAYDDIERIIEFDFVRADAPV